ncbi:hypothetical protein GQR58_007496 [Nymphon striatum]|nr:hypothetical protein GQR58_007496 [Nymphon striatum]
MEDLTVGHRRHIPNYSQCFSLWNTNFLSIINFIFAMFYVLCLYEKTSTFAESCIEEDCSSGECVSKSMCENGGICMNNVCRCSNCYDGNSCQEYSKYSNSDFKEDQELENEVSTLTFMKYKPLFLDTTNKTITIDRSGYEIDVGDDDVTETCEGNQADCPCSSFLLYLPKPTDVFELIDNVLIVKDWDLLQQQSESEIEIAVRKLRNPPHVSDDRIKLKIRHEFEDTAIEQSLNRMKRATLAAVMPAMDCTLESSDPARDDTLTLALGTRLSYVMSCTVGNTGAEHTNMLVEITTNVDPTLAAGAGIYNVEVLPIPGGVVLEDPDLPKIEYNVDRLTDHYNSVVVDYGYMIVSPAEAVFNITFDIVIAKSTLLLGDTIYGSVGVDFHGSALIWVGSDPYVLPGLDFCASTVEPQRHLCGWHSAAPILRSIPILNASSSSLYYHLATNKTVRLFADYGTITNGGDDKGSNIDDNKIVFGFMMCGKTEGSSFTVSIGITIGTDRLYVSQFDTTVGAAVTPAAPTSTTPEERSVTSSTTTPEITGTVKYDIRLRFVADSSYSVAFSVDDAGGRVSVCSVTIKSAGANFFCLPDVAGCLVHEAGFYTCDLGMFTAYPMLETLSFGQYLTTLRHPSTDRRDDDIYFTLGLNILEHASNINGATLSPTISVSGDLLVVDQLTLQDAKKAYVPAVTMANTQSWTDLVNDGIVAGSVTMVFDTAETVGTTEMELIVNCGGTAHPLSVCLFEVESAGNDMPCMKGNINGATHPTVFSSTDDVRTNVAKIPVNEVCATGTTDASVRFRYAVQSTPGETSAAATCSIGLGMKMSNDYLWVGMDERTVSAYASSGTPPILNTEVFTPGGKSPINGVVMVIARLKFYKDSMTKVILKGDNGASSDYGICGAKVYRIGKDLPCLDKENIEEIFVPDLVTGVSDTHEFNLKAVANIGTKEMFYESYDDDATISVVYGLKILSGAGLLPFTITPNYEGVDAAPGTENVNVTTDILDVIPYPGLKPSLR